MGVVDQVIKLTESRGSRSVTALSHLLGLMKPFDRLLLLNHVSLFISKETLMCYSSVCIQVKTA